MLSLTTSCENFLKPLKCVEGIVERNQTLPIIGNVHISVDGNRVAMTTTDLDIQIRTSCTVEGADGLQGAFTVNASKLASVLGAFAPQTSLNLVTDDSMQRFTVETDRSKYSMPTLPADDFPSLVRANWKSTIELPANVLRHLFTMTSFAIPPKLVRKHLNGVLLEIDGPLVRAVATDTHRLACYETRLDASVSAEPMAVTIPKKSVRELTRLLPEDATVVQCRFTETQACFEFNDIEFTTKLIEGRFPNYRQVLESTAGNPFHIDLNREQLLNTLKRVSIMTNEKFRGIRWKLGQNLLNVHGTSPEHEEALETLDIDWTGDELEMAFNVNYIVEVLALMRSTAIRVQFGTSSGAVLFLAPDADSFRYVVMPMRI